MSILTEKLPEALVVCGQICPIRTDFKTWLRFSQLIAENELTTEKIVNIFKLVFYEIPPNLFEALNAIMRFYAKSEDVKQLSGKNTDKKRYFDFEADGDLIYSAFLQQYGIDLCDADLMHWWKFKALMNGLSENTHFVKVVQYRSMDLSKIKDKEQKKFYRKMKTLYKLPDHRSEAQKEKDFNSAMEGLF